MAEPLGTEFAVIVVSLRCHRFAAHRHGRATWNGVRSHCDVLTKSGGLPRIGMAEPLGTEFAVIVVSLRCHRLAAHRHGRATWNGVRRHSGVLAMSQTCRASAWQSHNSRSAVPGLPAAAKKAQ